MDDLAVALALADRADEITMRHFRRSELVVRTKSDRSVVSEADTETELALRDLVAEHRPGDGFLGEEFGAAGRAADGRRRWIVDPVDATSNFVRGIPVFATLIGLEEADEVTAGVVSAPGLGHRWWAARGQGACADGRPIHVSGVADLADAHISVADLHRWAARGQADRIVEIENRARSTFGAGGFWAQMLLAEGRGDATLAASAKIWDNAAIKVVVEEAGGRFTDLDGAPRIDGNCALATNGLLHTELLELLAADGGPQGP
jgi:histidinol-phosphatase